MTQKSEIISILYFQDVCIGPIIKYAVFDAFFGVVCALLLIFGAHLRNNCLLISWVVITICTSLKYVYVVVFSDWSRLEVKNKFGFEKVKLSQWNFGLMELLNIELANSERLRLSGTKKSSN